METVGETVSRGGWRPLAVLTELSTSSFQSESRSWPGWPPVHLLGCRSSRNLRGLEEEKSKRRKKKREELRHRALSQWDPRDKHTKKICAMNLLSHALQKWKCCVRDYFCAGHIRYMACS